MSLKKHLIGVCQKNGLIDPKTMSWMIPIVVDGEKCGLGFDQICRNVRTYGGEMSLEEKKTLGLSGRIKISWKFYDTLTAIGKQDPINAISITVHTAIFGWNREKKAQEFTRSPNKKVKVKVVMDDLTCAAAKNFHDKVYDQNAAPHFPLSDCDAKICRCVLGLHYERRH